MNRHASIGNAEKAHIYAKLGRLISSVGQKNFLTNVHRLIETSVPISRLELSEWTVDDTQSNIVDVHLLGYTGLPKNLQIPPHHPINAKHCSDHCLVKRVLEADGAMLIHLNTRMKDKEGNCCLGTSHQCSLISRKANRRCVISLYRPKIHRDFSLQELSFLRHLSETLLPLSERHAHVNRQPFVKTSDGTMPHSLIAIEQTQLQRDFNERLSQCDVTLSMREKEACLGQLAGHTVPEIAKKLRVKNSSIETYLKRATAKLGVSGRHGLAKWVIGGS